jgi:hypothetical protein
MIGWGGGCCGDAFTDGAAYNPATNTWRRLLPAPVGGQQSPTGVWTGRELVILNGRNADGPGSRTCSVQPGHRQVAPNPVPARRRRVGGNVA